MMELFSTHIHSAMLRRRVHHRYCTVCWCDHHDGLVDNDGDILSFRSDDDDHDDDDDAWVP